eukprot:3763583-Pleurochrysis_carterae.AAC.1
MNPGGQYKRVSKTPTTNLPELELYLFTGYYNWPQMFNVIPCSEGQAIGSFPTAMVDHVSTSFYVEINAKPLYDLIALPLTPCFAVFRLLLQDNGCNGLKHTFIAALYDYDYSSSLGLPG